MKDISKSLQLIITKLETWWDSIILSAPNVILMIVTLIFGIWAIKWIRKLIRKSVHKFAVNRSLQSLIINIASVMLYIGLFIILLAILGLHKTIAGILASAGVAGLAVGLALQDPLMNLFSGVLISMRSSINIGDYIESNGFTGTVLNISLSSTIIRQLTGEEVIIPNKSLLQNPIKNLSTNGLRRIDIACGISYGDDLLKVKSTAIKAVKEIAYTGVERPVEFIYTSFGDSSINFQLRIWTNPPDVWTYLDKKSEAIIKLKQELDREDIMIPFPIRTLDFGIKGGTVLKEALPTYMHDIQNPKSN